MKTVLISGAYGFVGTNLAAYLHTHGHQVWALDLPQAQVAHGTTNCYAQTFHWEQLNAIPLAQIDAVIHLAGKAHDTRNTTESAAYFAINAGLTQTLSDLFAGIATPHRPPFILFSSVKAVADNTVGILTEEALPAPQTPYGQSKLQAEKIVVAAQPHHYILRPCMIHGPGNKGNLNLLYKVVSKRIPWPLGAFNNRRSFAAIGNVCAVVKRLIEGSVAPGTYHVADDEPLATNEIIRLMAQSLGQRPHIWRINKRLIRGVAHCGDYLHLPLTGERLRKLTESYVVSNLKLKQALGWQHMPICATQGLRTTLHSFTT